MQTQISQELLLELKQLSELKQKIEQEYSHKRQQILGLHDAGGIIMPGSLWLSVTEKRIRDFRIATLVSLIGQEEVDRLGGLSDPILQRIVRIGSVAQEDFE